MILWNVMQEIEKNQLLYCKIQDNITALLVSSFTPQWVIVMAYFDLMLQLS